MIKKISSCVLILALVSAPVSRADDVTNDMPISEAITADKYFTDINDVKSGTVYMFGDWKGTRTKLADDNGVTFASSFVCDILGNVTGGNEQGGRYDHSMGWDLNIDLEKFATIKGMQTHVSGLWRQGQNLSKACIGNALVTSSIYGHEQFRFYGLWLEQDLFNKALNIRIGRIAAGDDFASSPLYWTFVSNGIDGNPITIPINLFFSCYPTAVWGARAKMRLPNDIWLMSGVYNGDERVGDDKYAGLNFSMRFNRGMFIAEEIAYKPNQDPGSKGMPGQYKAGFYYDSAVFRDLYADQSGASYAITGAPPKKVIGNYGVYLHADQMIYREGGPRSDQGLTALAVTALAPSGVNQFSAFFMSGLIYEGLIPGRDDDVTAVQIMYAKWGDGYRANKRDSGSIVPSYETVLEWTHKINITQWMYLQPDMQYIINPGGGNNIDDTFVIGTRFGIIF